MFSHAHPHNGVSMTKDVTHDIICLSVVVSAYT